jgi:hypothetical protein
MADLPQMARPTAHPRSTKPSWVAYLLRVLQRVGPFVLSSNPLPQFRSRTDRLSSAAD